MRSPLLDQSCDRRDRVGWVRSCCLRFPSSCGIERIASAYCQLIRRNEGDMRKWRVALSGQTHLEETGTLLAVTCDRTVSSAMGEIRHVRQAQDAESWRQRRNLHKQTITTTALREMECLTQCDRLMAAVPGRDCAKVHQWQQVAVAGWQIVDVFHKESMMPRWNCSPSEKLSLPILMKTRSED